MFKLPTPPMPPVAPNLTLRTTDEDVCTAVKVADGYYLRSVYDHDERLFVVSGCLTASTLVFAFYNKDADEYYVSLREPLTTEDTESEFLFTTVSAQREFYGWVVDLQNSLRP